MGCSPEAGAAACPDCLERLVRSDLDCSGLSFVHGLSHSPLPFAASAVVQVASDGAEESNGRQTYSSFVLVGLCGGKVPFGSKKCDNNSLENGIHKDPQAEQRIYNDGDQYTEQSDSSSGKGCSGDHKSPSGLSKQQQVISTITKLTPARYLSIGHTSEVRELISSYLNFSTEENVINSLNLLSENKISGFAGLDFLSFVGFSAFDDLHPSGCVRHPNILPVLGILETSDCCYMLYPKAPYTLENIMHYSPEAFRSDWHIRFLIYQIISALGYLHDSGIHHANLRPSNILMSDSLWPYLSISDTCPIRHSWGFADPKCSPNSCCFMEDCSSKAIYTGFKLQSSLDWQSYFKQWWKGELSNYEYLLVLNKLAGRRWGDPAFHTVMPWVIDFTVMPDKSSDSGWRDLTKSKWRLAKGDEQLDFTYSSSEVPHHVSDECLSELAVCSYKARRLPKTILRSAVRSVYEPNEYPSSMQRLYQWTPDECIPEFYSDPRIFASLHSEMSDLALPSWATSTEDFICLHRDALESDRVSQQLHHWIDITFGYKLSGEASVEAKNVMLPPSDPSRPKSIGRHQLFTRPHPKRLVSTPHAVYHNKMESCARCCGKRSSATTDAVLNDRSPNALSEIGRLEEFEKATLFAELEHHLNPIYDYADTSTCCYSAKYPKSQISDQILQHDCELPVAADFDFGSFLECFESDGGSSMGYQELLLWNQKSYSENELHANDVFSIGCMLAEIYLQRPLFDTALLAAYKEIGIVPGALQELPSHVALLVESCIQREWKRQAQEYSHLKVALLQDSFVRDLWKKLGKQTYIEKTILPLIHCFGKGLCADGIDTLVRIGGLLGETFVVKQILPLLRNVILSCIDSSKMSKPEPQHSWNSFALVDGLSALEGLVSVLPIKAVLKELLQVSATALVDLCRRIGPENTSIYVLSQLKELFAELAFSHESSGLSLLTKGLKTYEGNRSESITMESRIDLVLLLYPFFASLVGIEKLRECCSTWFLLEQALQRLYNWKWEPSGDCSKNADNMKGQRFQPSNYKSSEFVPTKLLFNGAGRSVPQSETSKMVWNAASSKPGSKIENETSSDNSYTSTSGNQPWFWFPSPDSSWGAPEFLGRGGGVRDELPWKIKASILYSARAHPGALRSLAVHDDEFTVFTGGVGPGFKGSIQRWELPNVNCTSGYYGHEEVVNSICILSITGRVASCDGTIHIWNGQTGKLIAAHAESSITFPLQTASIEQANMLNQDALSGGILSNAFRGSLYTTMHYMESDGILVAGMGNGSIRFIDISRDQKLHLWKSDSAEISFSSLVSAICSCGSNRLTKGTPMASSWIAAGLSSGYCRLLDKRSGNIVAVWRAHDGHITKLAAPDDHLIVSSSFDKTLRVWDLRGNLATQSNIFRSHSDGISNFSVWGQDVVSISRNKIALTSLSRPASDIAHQQLALQNLYSADRGMKHKNLSVLSTIAVLPLSRLFVVGTEDGFLKICH
ncbi:Protein GFS12 [Dichanthelium oligosanthes]|uniref:Protein GFS12 n=1 Tax=Dichanthelium oligosanthes TaxID=888268 RepID=A0A1E5UJ10_9POAL|nr:Protein GFS12 [Dichanthelium oligosanthes]